MDTEKAIKKARIYFIDDSLLKIYGMQIRLYRAGFQVISP
jgi:hypothetical protein